MKKHDIALSFTKTAIALPAKYPEKFTVRTLVTPDTTKKVLSTGETSRGQVKTTNMQHNFRTASLHTQKSRI